MPLKVIGAGFGRTGTMSLKLALDQLGFGPCYHMAEVMTRPDHDTMWLALARGEASDWGPILDGFNATVDWPSTYFWRRLAADNPDAKIVLTVRDAEAWYRAPPPRSSVACSNSRRFVPQTTWRRSIPHAGATWRWSTPSS